jgi:hypothetical protein
MPEFPRHNSERALTTQQPRAMRDDADIRTDAVDRNKIADKTIKDVSDTATKWQASVEKIQSDTAMYNYKVGLLEIENEAALDPDISSEAKYQKRIQDLGKSVTKGIDNAGLINSMTPELNYLSNVGSLGLQQTFRKKTIIHGQAIMQGAIALEVNNPTPYSQKNIKLHVSDGVKQGLWDEVTGAKLEKDSLDQLKENMFIQDLNANPAETKKKMLSNDYNFDIEELENAGKVYERELQVIRDQTEKEFIKMRIDGTLTEDSIKAAVKTGKIDPNAAISMIKDLNTVVAPTATKLEKDTEFSKLVAMRQALREKESSWLGLGNADFEERTKYRSAVYNAHRKGLITDDQLETDFLTQEITDKFNNDPVFHNAQKEIFALSEQYETQEEKQIARAEMSQSLTRKVANGMNPKDALEAASAEQLAKNFPGINPANLLASAKKRGITIWQMYKLIPGNK